jgi:hypothetical protein
MAKFQQSIITLFDCTRYNHIVSLNRQNAYAAAISTVSGKPRHNFTGA